MSVAVDTSEQGYALNGERLSVREIQVLYLVAHGHSNRSIGAALFVTENTVKTHLRKTFPKLGARDRAHAVTIAFRLGILRHDCGQLVSTVAPHLMPTVTRR